MNEKTQTKFEKIIDCWAHAISLLASYDDRDCQGASEFATLMSTNLQGPNHGIPKSELAVDGINCMNEFTSGQLINLGSDKDSELNRAIREVRDHFHAQFPDFQEKMRLKLEKAIARGRVRTDEEFYLIQDLIYELEGPRDDEAKLNMLYGMVDNYEGV